MSLPAMPSLDESKSFIPLNIAVLTISDTRSPDDDKSGAVLVERLTAAGHRLAAREIVADDVEGIRAVIRKWIAEPGIDAIITTGGTGFTGRDVTPEAIEPLFEKRMDGFSIAFHMLSYEKIGVSTIQSRATAGVAGATYIFCLPGSPSACRDGWDGLIGPQLDYRTRPCNFVEIMPRWTSTCAAPRPRVRPREPTPHGCNALTPFRPRNHCLRVSVVHARLPLMRARRCAEMFVGRLPWGCSSVSIVWSSRCATACRWRFRTTTPASRWPPPRR